MKKIKIKASSHEYDITIGHGIRFEINELINDSYSSIMIITDEVIENLYLNDIKDTLNFDNTTKYIIPSGEAEKSINNYYKIHTRAIEAGLDRNSLIIALGGGVVGDIAGFVAATYMRGIRFVQMPTTILAHDSSVGGKVAVNHPLAKNIIGAFHQPELVLYDTATLRTLPEREIKAGLAEVVKHGLIWDKQFTHWCETQVEALLALDPQALQTALYKGCSVKASVVSEDEKENGLRAI